ncbi:MAG: hypothetical protein DWQ34_12180 [Planctomycetota bacterium]|nr:MAG: hypothetical protein DWQ34_12180 [Planctomycetota bacterium]
MVFAGCVVLVGLTVTVRLTFRSEREDVLCRTWSDGYSGLITLHADHTLVVESVTDSGNRDQRGEGKWRVSNSTLWLLDTTGGVDIAERLEWFARPTDGRRLLTVSNDKLVFEIDGAVEMWTPFAPASP